jgi:exonuclease VII small subunit
MKSNLGFITQSILRLENSSLSLDDSLRLLKTPNPNLAKTKKQLLKRLKKKIKKCVRKKIEN